MTGVQHYVQAKAEKCCAAGFSSYQPRSPLLATFLISMKKSSHPIDIHVGKRLKQQRLLQGISQESLAKQLGITFQQIQKYENATNRISASKLYQLSQVLEVPIQYFFDNELQH